VKTIQLWLLTQAVRFDWSRHSWIGMDYGEGPAQPAPRGEGPRRPETSTTFLLAHLIAGDAGWASGF